MTDIASNPLLGLLQEQALLDDLQLETVNDEVNKSGKSAFQAIQDFGYLDKDSLPSSNCQSHGRRSGDNQRIHRNPRTQGNHRRQHREKLSMHSGGLRRRRVASGSGGPFGSFPNRRDGIRNPASDSNGSCRSRRSGKRSGCVYDAAGVDIKSGIADILKELGVEAESKEGQGEIAIAEDALDLGADFEDAPIVKFVNLVLTQAVQDRASDIHFEPFENEYKIRYRVDGALYEIAPPPKSLAMPIASRIKVMSNLNISERRLPQDGRISVHLGGRQVDLRVSTLPTSWGESVVLRVLDRTAVTLELEHLGFPAEILEYTTKTIEQPNGIFVVTGPTSCGKTTTLYSCLRRINRPQHKLLTVEDPVEFNIEGIMQVQVHEAVGMTFAAGLRAFLRQDPDIIMVGEMRDLETSQIAIQASLTGHLVLSTLHTNDAPGTVTRLTDMGVEPFLVSSTLVGVMGQRLVRTVCRRCKTPFEPTERQLSLLNLSPHDIGGRSFHFGRGCGECNDSGYRGRERGFSSCCK